VVHEPPIQIRYRSVGSHEALGRLTRDGLKEWTLLEHPQWDEDLCVQLAEALPDNPWAAAPQVAFASDEQGGPPLIFANYAIDDVGRILVRGSQLQWHVRPADLARASTEHLNRGDQSCIFLVIEEYGLGGNGHMSWQGLLQTAADETMRNVYWLGLLGLFSAGRKKFEKRRFAKARALARVWVEYQGVIGPTELREYVDTRDSWDVERLARRLALPVKGTEELLKRLGYVHQPGTGEWARSDQPKALRRRDSWIDMEGPPWVDMPAGESSSGRKSVSKSKGKRKKGKSSSQSSKGKR